MPKQNFEIKNFGRGIVSNPEDERDVPLDAASYSLNIDPQTNGVLKGMPADVSLKTSGFWGDFILMAYVQGGAEAGTCGAEGPAPSVE